MNEALLKAVTESAKTPMLSVTHAPIGKGGKNWITKLKPGNRGELPAYIQNVRNAIMRDGKDESEATEIAIGRIQGWAEGKGNVSPEVRAAAAKAIAEWEKMKAQNKAQSTAKKTVKEAVCASLGVLEATSDGDAEDKSDGGSDESSEDQPKVFCVKCRKKVKPTDSGKCPNCGTDLSKAVAQAKKVKEAALGVLEAKLSMAQRKNIDKSNFAIPEKAPGPGSYPIHDKEHARKALQLAGGKPEESRVRGAVFRKYPDMKPGSDKKKQ